MIEIINAALNKLGQDNIIEINENTPQGRKANSISYEQVKKSVLESHPWNFALKRAQIAPTSEKPVFGEMYQFLKPSDCLRIVENEEKDYNYKVEGRYIYSNLNKLEITYVSSETHEGLFSNNFSDALSCKLAHELCYTFTGSTTLKESLWSEYIQKIAEARSIDSRQGTTQKIDSYGNVWIEARY